ncbi:MAG: DUF2877 domain-containing protein [Candidatus Dormibacterales bacterium]
MSRALVHRLFGPTREGVGLGHGYVLFGGWVLALTGPGQPRMPNGVECEARLAAGQPCLIGGGRLLVDGQEVRAGPLWEPRPPVRVRPRTESRPARPPDPEWLAGRGPGLTPAGDDLLAGYAAGLVLFHGRLSEARAIADAAAPRTTSLSATLLRHASRGELPEPAHALLELGDVRPLLRFGHSSGRAMAAGLAAAAAFPNGAAADRRARSPSWPA